MLRFMRGGSMHNAETSNMETLDIWFNVLKREEELV